MRAATQSRPVRDLLLDASANLYSEHPGLVGFGYGEQLEGRALRASERAVAARLAVQVARALRAAGSTLMIDVEYSRGLLGVAQKKGPSGQICPDLIVHRQGRADRNVLAVELELRIPQDPTVVDKRDDRKMRHH